MTTLARSLQTRTVRRLEKPRPLNRPTETVESFTPAIEPNVCENVMTLIDFVSSSISKENFDDVLAVNIGMLCKQLEVYGAQLEASNKAQLDQAFYLFRDASRDSRLDHLARLNLLKLIELRDSHWQPGNNFTTFYTASFSPATLENAVNEMSLNSKASVPYAPLSPVLNPGEMIKASGKFPKPTKMPGKSYCKDEVVIRNADSGKVMGIKGRRVHMIEELSETIISFQRVPSGAKERLVQITGPSEDNITHAIHLMDDTIRRNASPIREPAEKDQMGGSSSSLNSSASDESNRLANHSSEKRLHSNSTNESSLNEYKYTVTVGNEVIRIVSGNFGLAMTAKLVLDEHFANASNAIESPDYFSSYKNNSNAFVPGVNDVVPSISKNSSIENDNFKSSGLSLSNDSSLHPSFSSLSSSLSGISYPDITGSLLGNTLPSPTIAKPFSAYVDNNTISDTNHIANQSILSSSSSITSSMSPSDTANNVILSSPTDQITPLSIAEVSEGLGKAFSLNQSLSALLSVTAAKKDQPKIKQYSKEALYALRNSSICLKLPRNWDHISEEFPYIIKPRIVFSAPATPTASSAPSLTSASIAFSAPTTPTKSSAPIALSVFSGLTAPSASNASNVPSAAIALTTATLSNAATAATAATEITVPSATTAPSVSKPSTAPSAPSVSKPPTTVSAGANTAPSAPTAATLSASTVPNAPTAPSVSRVPATLSATNSTSVSRASNTSAPTAIGVSRVNATPSAPTALGATTTASVSRVSTALSASTALNVTPVSGASTAPSAATAVIASSRAPNDSTSETITTTSASKPAV